RSSSAPPSRRRVTRAPSRPSTPTPAVGRSSTGRARPARTVSTSGSSGTLGPVGPVGPPALLQPLVGGRRRLLLGDLLARALARAPGDPVEHEARGEVGLVVGPGAVVDVGRHAEAALGGE